MKKIYAVIMSIVLGLVLVSCSQGSNEPADNRAGTTKFNSSDPTRYSPYDSNEYTGINYVEAESLFQNAGFENISTSSIDDIDSESDIPDGAVENVSIMGNAEFTADTVFDKDDEVVITYHNIPKITAPLSSGEAASKKYMDAGKVFFDAGFRNIKTDEVYDLAFDESNKTILLANGKEIEHAEPLPFDSTIEVVEHFPARGYLATITIDFHSNLLFSKYDVKLSLNNQELGTMSHGEGGEYKAIVPPGKHEVLFVNADDNSITGKAQLEVDSKTDVTYQISCSSKEITVERTAFAHALQPGSILIPFNSTHYLRKDYKTVSEELSKLGFSNVKTEATTEMLWNPDKINSVIGIEINGKTEFKHDEAFKLSSPVTVYYHTADFTFDQTSVSVIEKETFELPYTLSSEDPIDSVEFKIDHPEVLKRNRNGSYTALTPGTAIVSSYSGGEIYSDCTVVVNEIIVPIEKLEFAAKEIDVSVGSTFIPKYKFVPENANYTDMRVEISNNFIEQGEDLSFYSAQEGDSEMTFYQDDRLLGTCTIHSTLYEIEELSLSETEKELYIGESFDLPFNLIPEKATAKGINVVSSNSNIAAVEFNERGEQTIKVTGISAGETSIMVTIPNGQQYNCIISVNEISPEEIVLSNTNPKQRIEVGTPITIDVGWKPDNTSVKELSWSSSDSNVIRVDGEGNLETVGVGTAVITATHKTGVSASLDLTVEPTLVKSVEVSTTRDNSSKFYIGNSFTISAFVLPENATDHTLKYSSNNEAVATVNDWGVVTAVGTGETTITVASPNGPKNTISVTVSAAPQKFRINYSANLVSNDHVGNNWSVGCSVDGEPFWNGGTIILDPDSSFRIVVFAQENDKDPDYGSYWEEIKYSDDLCKNGYSTSGEFHVIENGGRYSRHSAVWKYSITITPTY